MVLSLVLGAMACGEKSGLGPSVPGDSESRFNFVLPDVTGEDVEVESQAGDVFALAFWATHCAPSRNLLLEFETLSKTMSARGLSVYGISIDGPETVARVPAFLQGFDLSYPMLMDSDTSFYTKFNSSGDCPYYVIVDAQGNMVRSHQGHMKGDVDGALANFLESYLPPEPSK